MDFLHFVDSLRSVDLKAVAVVVLVETVVCLVALLWARLRRKKRIAAQIVPDDDRRLAQLIQSQQTEIEMLTEQLISRRTRQMSARYESIGTHELTEVEIAQRDDALADFASERY